ncbi:MAG: purine nucleoside phosphorylase [marine bacterium B5-7]|nr:MAG: purine nucleoside phosphorylase [marine bacterium B5-7]
MTPADAAAYIQTKTTIKPKVALILGSGMANLSSELMPERDVITYDGIPGFPEATVAGHAGELWLGKINETPAIIVRGRFHYYETGSFEHVKHLIRTLRTLGCEQLLMTNAAGSLKTDMAPGALMLLTDHINYMGVHPMVGPNDDTLGSRFYSMTDAYDPAMRERFLNAAKEQSVALAQGIYIAVTGPSYETPAEIRAFHQWGASAVGMSTVPETLIARHCGLQVAAISQITNFGAGLSDTPPTHEEVLEVAKAAAGQLVTLIKAFF